MSSDKIFKRFRHLDSNRYYYVDDVEEAVKELKERIATILDGKIDEIYAIFDEINKVFGKEE